MESRGHVRWPKRYRNEFGQLIEGAPYSERDIRRPTAAPDPRREGRLSASWSSSTTASTRSCSTTIRSTWWAGTATSTPGRSTSTTSSRSSAACTSRRRCTRRFRATASSSAASVRGRTTSTPRRCPAPYNHSNVDSDEVLYYASSEFMSRKGIEFGSITHHPDGIPHGPHPGRAEASIGAKYTDELAVMMDTFRPLKVAKPALAIEDPAIPQVVARRAARAVQSADELTPAAAGGRRGRDPSGPPERRSAIRAREHDGRSSRGSTAPAAHAGAEAVSDFSISLRWSVARPEAFWPEVWGFCGVVADERPGRAPVGRGRRRARPDGAARSGARARAGSRRAAQLRREPAAVRRRPRALVFWNERGRQRRAELRELQIRGRRASRGAPGARRRRGRSGRRVPAEPARDRRRDARRPRASARSGRRARPTSAPTACSTASGRSGRACSSAPTATATPARRSTRSRACARCARGFRRSSGSSSCPTCSEQPASRPRSPARCCWHDLLGERAAELRPVRAAAVRSSALHHVLVGHDRPAQVHGARRRRHAAAASEGARAAHRPHAATTGSSTSPPAAG